MKLVKFVSIRWIRVLKNLPPVISHVLRRRLSNKRLQISLVTLAIFTPLALLGLWPPARMSLPPGWKPFRAGSRLGELGREKAIDNLIKYSHVLSLSAKEFKGW